MGSCTATAISNCSHSSVNSSTSESERPSTSGYSCSRRGTRLLRRSLHVPVRYNCFSKMQTIGVSPATARSNILVIRRDNIGDLILTTPLIHALRQRFPEAWIGALVNSYNARVLDANPDINEVFVYTKAKHRGSGSALSAYWSTLSLIIRLRTLKIDFAILASPAASSKAQMFARRINARTIVGFGDCADPDVRLKAGPAGSLHEVDEVFRIARFFGIDGSPP